MNVLDVGCGTNDRVLTFYPAASVTKVDKLYGWDIEKLGLPNGQWDLIFANHIIEHLEDVDGFLNSCKVVMSNKTILEIGTPNLCAWFNRILFLMGYLPHSYELSHLFQLGKIGQWSTEELGGHIRVFNVTALRELLIYHGFDIISCVGEASTYPSTLVIKCIDKWLTRNVNLASAFRIQCRFKR